MTERNPTRLDIAAGISGYGLIGASGAGIVAIATHEGIQPKENMLLPIGSVILLTIIGAILASRLRVPRGPNPKR